MPLPLLNQDLLDLELSFSEKMYELFCFKNKIQKKNRNPLKIVISGAGPAGLIRGIQAVLEGHHLIIIEKRANDDLGRPNPILLRNETIIILKRYGIYQFLTENKKTYTKAEDFILVSIRDMEEAMKVVLQEISPETVVLYQSFIEKIDRCPSQKINILLEKIGGAKMVIDSIDILLITEGARSRTLQEIFQTKKATLLPPIFLIGASSKPRNQGKNLWLSQINYRLRFFAYFFVFIYYLAKEGFGLFPNRSDISFLLPSKTVEFSYLGIVLSKKKSESLQKKCNECLDKHLSHWIILSVWYTIYYRVLSRFKLSKRFRCSAAPCLGKMFSWADFTFHRYIEYESSVSYEIEPAHLIERSICLVAGDAFITVDPLVGIGCNSAIQNSVCFLKAIQDFADSEDSHQIINNYKKSMLEEMESLYKKTISSRMVYRPDTLTKEQIQMSNLTQDLQTFFGL